MKALAYLRVSGKGQIDGDGFTRQRLAIAKHAEAHGLEIVATFEERGVTGEAYGDTRPAWLEMLTACESQSVKIIVIEKLDRLARDLMVQETFIRDLKRSGIDLHSSQEPDLCSADPTRVMMRQIMGAVAQYDKAQIVAKLRGARERVKAATGKCEGKKGYGEHPAIPEEKKTLAWMRQWYEKTGSFNQVAKELNARGILGRHGATWDHIRVANILRRGGQLAPRVRRGKRNG